MEKPIRKSKPIAEKEPSKLMKKQEQESKEDEPKTVSAQPPLPKPAPTVVAGAPPTGTTAGVAETKYIVMDELGNQSVVDFGADKVTFKKRRLHFL